MSQKAVLLWKLKQGPVCSFSFYQPGSGLTHRAAARVQDLKREGYEITSRPCDLGHGHLSRAVVYELQTNGRLF